MKHCFARIFGVALLATTAVPTAAQTFTEWKDLKVNSLHRLPMRTDHFAYESVEAALEGDRSSSINYL